MIPYSISGTNERRRLFPLVTLALLAANGAVFFHELQLQAQGNLALNRFLLRYALVPCEFAHSCRIPAVALRPYWLTLISSMFMHAGWLHLLGNMLFLFLFGRYVESAFGHLRYLLFYLLAGLAASGLEIATARLSSVPGLGASGAIAGVLAAYLVLHPRSRVRTLVPIIELLFPLWLPAWLMIGIWFLIQLLNGSTALSTAAGESAGGVAYMAHVGGFLAGLVLVWPLRQDRTHSARR